MIQAAHLFVAKLPSHETIVVLNELLKAALAGELTGVAFAGLYRQRRYIIGWTGECNRHPTFTRGMVDALHDYHPHEPLELEDPHAT